MSGPLVSLVIPTYNRAGMLAATLDHIGAAIAASRHASAIEVLVHDNGSTDDTADRVAQAAARYPQVRYAASAINLGPDANFMLALAQSRGRYVQLFGDDDRLGAGWFDFLCPQIARAQPIWCYLHYQTVRPDEIDRVLAASRPPDALELASASALLPRLGVAPSFMSANLYRGEPLRALLAGGTLGPLSGSFMIHLALAWALARSHPDAPCAEIRPAGVYQVAHGTEGWEHIGRYAVQGMLRAADFHDRLAPRNQALGAGVRRSIAKAQARAVVIDKALRRYRWRDLFFFLGLLYRSPRFWSCALPLALVPSALFAPLRVWRSARHARAIR